MSSAERTLAFDLTKPLFDALIPEPQPTPKNAPPPEEPVSDGSQVSPPPPDVLRFFPQAGNAYGDLLFVHYLDLDRSSAAEDYNCGSFTYDGHPGVDSALRTFEEQRIGVPVFAAEDGVVRSVIDGNPDENTWCSSQPANAVTLDHGDGRRTFYVHLRRNSIPVEVGDFVRAGTQIGLTGSSGCSTGPHLHFEVWEDGEPVELFSGACRPGTSGWSDQPFYKTATYLFDFGVTSQDLSAGPAHPHRWPTSAEIGFDDEELHFWARIANLPEDSSWRVQFLRPDGSLAYDTGVHSFDNSGFNRTSRWRWRYRLRELHTIAGTWKILLDVNGRRLIRAPFPVVAEKTPGFNRKPAAVGASFDPAEPSASDVLFCRISTSLTLDDPDWDLVRYEYRWTVNGRVVRQVTSAAHSDAVPRNVGRAGDVVECAVTPSDGRLSARTTAIQVTLGP